MKKLLMIISLLLLVFTAGCSKQQAADVPASPAADVAYSVTDDAGRTLHFEHKPQRIVSLTYGTDEILTDLVDIKRIMAYSRWAGDSEISFITKEQAYTVGRKVPENTEAVYDCSLTLLLLQRPPPATWSAVWRAWACRFI